jgi:peptidoglycan hydrolase CwlO-like protein
MTTTTDLLLGLSSSLETLIQAQASSQEAQEALQQSNAQKDALIEHLQTSQGAAQEELTQINQSLSTLFDKARNAVLSNSAPSESPGADAPTTPEVTTSEGMAVVPSSIGGVIDTAAMPTS